MADSLYIEAMLAEIESSYGTDPTPTAATDAVRLAERVWPVMTISNEYENDRLDTVSGTLLPVLPAEPQGRVVRLNFAVEPQPSGATYTAVTDLLGYTALKRCTGASATVATGGIEFDPVSASLESTTIYVYSGGQLYPIVGCRGRSVLVAEAGQPLMERFEVTGLLRTAPTTAAIPTATYLSDVPPAVVSASLAVGSWNPDFGSFEMDFGQDVQILPSGNAADGIAEIVIVRQEPHFRLTAQTPTLATYNAYAVKASRSSNAISCSIGSGTGLVIELNSVTGYLVGDIGHVDVNGYSGWSLDYLCTGWQHRFD